MTQNIPPKSIPNINFLGKEGMALARNMYHFHKNRGQENSKFDISALDLHARRYMLPISLAYYSEQLADTNPAMFQFLTQEQKQALSSKLNYTCLLLLNKYQLEEMEGGRLSDLKNQIQRCGELIDRLSLSMTENASQSPHLVDDLEAEGALKYDALQNLGPAFARDLIDAIPDSSEGSYGAVLDTTGQYAIEAMSYVNGHRLYWVWGSSMLQFTLENITKGIINVKKAMGRLELPSNTTGYMSWVLYYTRLGTNIALLLKHTFKNPFMTRKESQIPPMERFKTQWKQRKWSIFNDAPWSLANMVCFKWLKGSGWAGYGGNVLTAALLLMDLGLTCWRYLEESTDHNKRMYEINQAMLGLKNEIRVIEELNEVKELQDPEVRELHLQHLRAQQIALTTELEDLEAKDARLNSSRISALNKQLAEMQLRMDILERDKERDEELARLNQILSLLIRSSDNDEDEEPVESEQEKNLRAQIAALENEKSVQLIELRQQVDDLKKLSAHTQQDWDYKRRGIEYEMTYSAALLVAFSIMSCGFLPPTIITTALAAAIGLAGATLCFLFTAIHAVMTARLAIEKTREQLKQTTDKGQLLLEEFHNTEDINARKRIYLELQALTAKSIWQERIIRHQKIELIRSTLIDAVVPGLVFMAISLMPFGAGVGMLVGAFLLMALSKGITKYLEPQMDELPEFDEEAFAAFSNNPPEKFSTKSSKQVGFFNRTVQPDEDENETDTEQTPLLSTDNPDVDTDDELLPSSL